MNTSAFSRRIGFLAVLWASVLALPLFAGTVTLPVAASATGQGGVPFVSDVRVFNTSYTDVLSVTAVYRFNGATQVFQLAPREARAFDDICVSLFATPQSLGAVEFTSNSDDLLVTSQLRSPADAGGHVGMFVPGLEPSEASVVSVLTSLVNGDSRTNVGVYNPNGVSVTATIRLFDGGVLLGTMPVVLGPHAVTQVNNIYQALGFGSLVKTNGYATVESSDPQSPLFTYAAEADNQSKDLILIVGAKDKPAPAGFNPPSPTAGNPAASPTPTPTVPSATPTQTPPAGTTFTVNVGPGGSKSFSPNFVAVHVGDTVKWVWQANQHSTTSGNCSGTCTQSGMWDSGEHFPPNSFSVTFPSPGTFGYFCTVHLSEMTGAVQVSQ